MTVENRQKLEEEIQEAFKSLSKIDVTTEEYRTAVEALAKLMDRSIELDRIENEVKDKERRTENDKLDRWITNGIAIAGIVIPSLITVWGTFKTLKFEETGTVTTSMGRGFISKLIPKK